MISLILHHYHLPLREVRRLTLRQIMRLMDDIPHVNPMVSTPEDTKKPGSRADPAERYGRIG